MVLNTDYRGEVLSPAELVILKTLGVNVSIPGKRSVMVDYIKGKEMRKLVLSPKARKPNSLVEMNR